jgi:hypothetical protein
MRDGNRVGLWRRSHLRPDRDSNSSDRQNVRRGNLRISHGCFQPRIWCVRIPGRELPEKLAIDRVQDECHHDRTPLFDRVHSQHRFAGSRGLAV